MTVAVTLSPSPILQFFDNSGKPLNKGTVETKVGGIDAVTYQDAAGTIPLPNPILLNVRGEIADASGHTQQLFLPTGVVYEFLLKDQNGIQVNDPISVTAGQSGEQIAALLSVITDNPVIASYARTAAEIAVGITPTNYSIPSHIATGDCDPRRYGAHVDGVTDDTAAINNAITVAVQANAAVFLPAGTMMASAVIFGSNSVVGESTAPFLCHGTGVKSIIKQIGGTANTTLFQAKGLSQTCLKDFALDGNSNTGVVCIDTSWGIVGPAPQNSYINLIVQNYDTLGWKAVNDNNGTMVNVTIRNGVQPTAISLQAEGSGGTMGPYINCAITRLALTAQNAGIINGFYQGIVVNHSQTSFNFFHFAGGVQLFPDAHYNAYFHDDTPSAAGHSIGSLLLDEVYFVGPTSPQTASVFDCGFSPGQFTFNVSSLNPPVSPGTWQLFSANAHSFGNSFAPTRIDLVGTALPSGFSLTANLPSNTTVVQRGAIVSGTGTIDDTPMRVIYRATVSPGVVTSGTFFNIVPHGQMEESGASYMLMLSVAIPATDNLAVAALVSRSNKNTSQPASGALSIPSTSNFANNLTNQISIRYTATDGSGNSGIDMSVNENTVVGTTVSVLLMRMGNPLQNF